MGGSPSVSRRVERIRSVGFCMTSDDAQLLLVFGIGLGFVNGSGDQLSKFAYQGRLILRLQALIALGETDPARVEAFVQIIKDETS